MRAYKWEGFLALQLADERVNWYNCRLNSGWHLFSAWDPIKARGVRWDAAGYFNDPIPVLRFMLITGVAP